MSDVESPNVLVSTTTKSATNPGDGTTITTVVKEYSNGTQEIEEITSKTEDQVAVPITKAPAVAADSVTVNSALTVPSGSYSAPGHSVNKTVVNVGGKAAGDDKKKGNCMATAAMVCGIVGLFFFGVILGTLAVILGCVAKGQIDKEPGKYKSNAACQANTGLILGIVGLAIWAIIIVVYF